MAGKRWKFVKKTFNALGMAKAMQAKPSFEDNDDSHNSDVDVEIRKPSSQPITTQERAKSKKSRYRGKKKDFKAAVAVADAAEENTKEAAAATSSKKTSKPKSRKTQVESESDRLARARARREELQQFKKRTEEDEFLCKALGMDENGMCLRHPNQLITTLGPTFEDVHRCRICDSESQVGSKAPRQRKSMATVIDQVKAMQANRDDWRKRTKVMFWTSKQGLDFDSDDEKALDEDLALTKEEWEEQVTARVTQVVAWRDENQLQAHPLFSRYFKMLEMGVPMEAVKNACQMDGYNPAVLDLEPAKPLKSQLGKLDKKIRLELEAVVDMKATENDEENLDVPELVTRVSVSFQKQMARDMLEAVQTLDALTEKAKKKKKSKRASSSKSGKSKQKDSSTSKEKKKEASLNDTGDNTLESPRKKKKRVSTKKEGKSTKRESIEGTDSSKKKKTRKSSRKSGSSKQIQDGNADGTLGDDAAQAKIAALNLALEEKDKEIESLKEQLRQKDTIIQHLSKRKSTTLRQKSNEFGSPTRPSMSSSEHAVIAPMSDDDDDATNDEVLEAPHVEYQLSGYDFKTGDSGGAADSNDGSESFVQDHVEPPKSRGKQPGEQDGDESINSDAGAVAAVGDDAKEGANDDGDDDDDGDDETSSASDVITTEDDLKIWRLGLHDTATNDPSNHEVSAKPQDDSTGDDKATEEESDHSDSGSEDGQDENDSSNGSEEDSDSDQDEHDDDEEEVWLSDLEGEGTERSNDSDASDEKEH